MSCFSKLILRITDELGKRLTSAPNDVAQASASKEWRVLFSACTWRSIYQWESRQARVRSGETFDLLFVLIYGKYWGYRQKLGRSYFGMVPACAWDNMFCDT